MFLLLASCTEPLGTRDPPPSHKLPDSTGSETGSSPGLPTAQTAETGLASTTGDTALPATGDTGGPEPRLLVYVGESDDHIHVFELDRETGALTETSDISAGASPSFLAFSPDLSRLYAVNEYSDEIAAFSIDAATGALSFLDRVSSNGNGPAHLTVDATGQFVLAANYGGGSVTSIAVELDGSLGARAATLATGPNAHEIVLDPTNQFAFVPNLGSDEVSQLLFDPSAGTLTENAVPAVSLPAGSGPRHLAFHPTAPYAYVISETGDSMTAMAFDPATGQLSALQTLSTLPASVDGADNYCAELAFGASGQFLYGSNRGHDSIVIFEVDASTGSMTLVGHQDTGGDWPRHFSLDPSGELLLVGNQQSNSIVSFGVDPVSGLLTELETTALSAGPAFVGIVALP